MESKVTKLDQGWNIINQGITKVKRILDGLPEPAFTSVERTRLFTTIYNMCTQKPPHNYSQQLYDKYKETFEDYFRSIVMPSLREKHDEFMLRELVNRWTNHQVMVECLSNMFSYLDGFFPAQHSLPDLRSVGNFCFRDLVYEEVHANAIDAVIALINRERDGEQIDRSLLKNVLGIIVEVDRGQMCRYERDFESQMLRDTALYYHRKAANWIEADSCVAYMLKAQECLKREKRRVSLYLPSSIKQKLLETVQMELLVTHEILLLEKEDLGFRALLRDNNTLELSRIFALYYKIPGALDPIANIFKQHVMDEGRAYVREAEEAADNEVVVGPFLRLLDKHMDHVNICFLNHTLFHKALQEAFDGFCNKSVAGVPFAETLAKCCDYILTKGCCKLNDEMTEGLLKMVVNLVAFINDKDLFEEFYRKRFADRMLFGQSAGMDRERSIVAKLKQKCGRQFTSDIERMGRDLTLAWFNALDFDKYLQEYLLHNPSAHPGIGFTVTVFTKGIWPTYKSSDIINLPSEMVKCREVFEGFYHNKTENRILKWIYSLGDCYINGKFEPKTIELIVSTYQATALLLFNNADRLSYSEIMAQLNLSDEDVGRILHSLSCGKYKILIKEPDTQTTSPKDSFEFNPKFTDQRSRIQIFLRPEKENDERKKVYEDVDKDRRYAIDAALVRIMKSKRTESHNLLVSECVELLSRVFKPDVKAIKDRIEDLINREYLERDKDNADMYSYLP